MIKLAELGWTPTIIAFVMSIIFVVLCTTYLVRYNDKVRNKSK